MVIIKIYNAAGKEIEKISNSVLKPGIYNAEWNASGFPSGVYFYRMQVNESNGKNVFTGTKRMVLIK